jgi:para-nitrobenzyl esterase
MYRFALIVGLLLLGACTDSEGPSFWESTPVAPDCSEPLETVQGKMTGRISRTGATCEYVGVRYAKPPVGELRFAPPQPLPAGTGTIAATTYRDQCLQKYSIDQMGVEANLGVVGKEDCLFLNIWRPQGEDLPVMLFIHGGAFTIGAGSWNVYEGDLLAQEGVIVVTINYRLGPMGFFAYGPGVTEGVDGNQGIRDQIAALQWVKENIASFGGNPGNVTIFGESAGSMSVCTLLASPLAKGLFHAAIMESGGCKSVASLETGYAHAASYAVDTGCSGAVDPLACMRKLPEDELIRDMNFDLILSALEPHVDGTVLTASPLEMIRSGDFNRVPLIAGSNQDELQIVALTNPDNLKLKTASWGDYYAALEASLDATTASGLRKHYNQAEYANPFDAWFISRTDRALACPTLLGAQAVAEHGLPAYHYIFNWEDLGALSRALGSVHALELFFVFGSLHWMHPAIPTERLDDAQKLSKQMRGLWASFARDHVPSADGMPAWPELGEGSLVINTESVVDAAIKRAACAWWDPYLPTGLEEVIDGVNALVENYEF